MRRTLLCAEPQRLNFIAKSDVVSREPCLGDVTQIMVSPKSTNSTALISIVGFYGENTRGCNSRRAACSLAQSHDCYCPLFMMWLAHRLFNASFLCSQASDTGSDLFTASRKCEFIKTSSLLYVYFTAAARIKICRSPRRKGYFSLLLFARAFIGVAKNRPPRWMSEMSFDSRLNCVVYFPGCSFALVHALIYLAATRVLWRSSRSSFCHYARVYARPGLLKCLLPGFP